MRRGLVALFVSIAAQWSVVAAQAPRSSPPPTSAAADVSSRRTFRFASSPSRPDCRIHGASRSCRTADILVTEREGRLRIVRNGTLDPAPIAGTPRVFARVLAGLLDVALHPEVRREPHRLSELLEGARRQPHDDRARARRVRRYGAQGRQGHLRRQFVEQVEHELRRSHRVRSSGAAVSHRWRAAGTGPRAEAGRPRRQGPASPRRRERAAGQSVRRQSRDTCRRSIRWDIAARRGWR